MFLETEWRMSSEKPRLYHADGKEKLSGLRRKPKDQFQICLLFRCVGGFQMQMLGKMLGKKTLELRGEVRPGISYPHSVMTKVRSLESNYQNLNP